MPTKLTEYKINQMYIWYCD